MANIGRRDFLRSIGFPALFLPFIKLFPSRLKKTNATPLPDEGYSFQIPGPRFGKVTAECSECGLTLEIPYVEGFESHHFVQTFPCHRWRVSKRRYCRGKIKFDAIIKTGGLKAFYHP